MARFHSSLPLVVILGLGTAGCAAPIKALMQNDAPPAAAAATVPQDTFDKDLLRIALEKRAAALRQELSAKPNATRSADKPQRLPDERLDTRKLAATTPTSLQSSSRVTEMLERTKTTAGTPALKPPSDSLAFTKLSTSFQVKNEARLSASTGTTVQGGAGQTLIRFDGKSTSLDTAGNSALASIIRKNENNIGYRIVIIGGLGGSGQTWEKMQLASSRIEAVANHVPPPIRTERQFDAALDVGEVRLEITKAGR